MRKKIKVGDRITFSATHRCGRHKVTRKVNGFYGRYPTVRYMGYGDFVVGNFPGDVIHNIEKGA